MRRWLNNLQSRWMHFRSDADLEAEMRIHAEMEAEDRLSRGIPETEARRLANIKLGKPLVAVEKIRDQELLTFAESVFHDLVLGLRAIRKNLVFSITAVLTLALGIGANTAIFSLLYGLLLRNLPTQSPSQLVEIGITSKIDETGNAFLTAEMLRSFRKELSSFSGISGWADWTIPIEDQQGSLRMYEAALVTGNTFEVMPLHASLGRLIIPSDDVRGGSPQGWPVVLSYGFWNDRFGKDPGVIGKQIRISETVATVVGVMPPEFKGIWPGVDTKIYLPLHFLSVLIKRDVIDDPTALFGFEAIGRLRPGVSIASARADLGRFATTWRTRFVPLKEQHNDYIEKAYLRVASASSGVASYITRTYSKSLYLMQVLVSVVLLLCCVNVGGLMLSKVYARRREFAVRTALGGRVTRLIRQYLTESLLIALAGSTLGAIIAYRCCDLLLHFFRDPMMFEPMEVTPDQSALWFAATLAIATTLLAGILPAWRVGRADPAELLKARTSLGGKRQVAGRAFVPVQVALSLFLVVLASVLTQSILKLRSEHTGFDIDHITIQTSPLYLLNLHGAALLNMYQAMVDRLNEMPDVRSAAVTYKTPMTGEEAMSHFEPVDNQSGEPRQYSLAFNDVGPGYFETMQTPVSVGRSFVKSDRSSNVCILNRSAAALLFPHQEALGRYVRPKDEREFPKPQDCRVIGIAEDAKFSDVRRGPPPTVYLPLSLERMNRLGNLVFLINSGSKLSAISAFRKTLAEKAPSVPLVTFVTLREQMDAALGSEELITLLSNFFGFVALFLTALGLYGLLSASVVQRTGEIGMRVALGADRSLVLRMILREALSLVAVGMLVGAVALFISAPAVGAMLHGVSVIDLTTVAAVVLVLLGVSFVAALLPAMRAAAIDPMEALRVDY